VTSGPLGRHILMDFYGCPEGRLDDLETLRTTALDAVSASGGTVLGVQAHRFQPHGVTVLVMVAESHLSLHTWPEGGLAAADYFTCGDRVDPGGAALVLIERLAPARHEVRELARGGGVNRATPPRPARSRGRPARAGGRRRTVRGRRRGRRPRGRRSPRPSHLPG